MEMISVGGVTSRFCQVNGQPEQLIYFLTIGGQLNQLRQMDNDSDFSEDLIKNYKYFTDSRQEAEVQLSNHLAHALSETNFHQLHSPLSTSPKTIRKQDFLYVCINGTPPFEDEFKFLNLPGECLYFQPTFFDKNLTSQEMMQAPMDLNALAKQLHTRINESGAKPIVAIFHSFGTYIFAQYCQMFKNDRIIGIIDVGGAPIRFYPVARTYISQLKEVSIEFIRQNLEMTFEALCERNKSLGLKGYEKKEHVFGVSCLFKSEPGFKEIFEYNRNLPKVLKCFIFGRKDTIFLENYMNQKILYYSYTNRFSSDYETQLQGAYQRCFGRKCQNVQERFIYSIEGAYHSVHMQKKFKDVNTKIVSRYLTFLQEVHSANGAKL